MKKRTYFLVVTLLSLLSSWSVSKAPVFVTEHIAYSVHDSIALVLCNAEQMERCGLGGSMYNEFTYSYLAVLIFAGMFVYSNSYAYPEGFRMMSILRFGSEKQYWIQTMRRNLKNALFAATVYVVVILALCAVTQYNSGFGAVCFVPYSQFTIVYILFWFKLLTMLSLISVFAEVFAQRIVRVGVIGGIIIALVLLLFIDVMQKKSAFLAIGSWQMQGVAVIGFLAVQILLLLYGKMRPFKL